MKNLIIKVLAVAAIAFAPNVYAQYPKVGGKMMYPTQNIVQNASKSNDHTTLVAALNETGLAQTLAGPGPFTVFAPTDEAFNRFPEGTVANLVRPGNRPLLTQILKYHVVPGRLSAAGLMRRVRAAGGVATLRTLAGVNLKVMQSGGKLYLVDTKGHRSMITIPDVFQSNGVIHVVNRVLMPD